MAIRRSKCIRLEIPTSSTGLGLWRTADRFATLRGLRPYALGGGPGVGSAEKKHHAEIRFLGLSKANFSNGIGPIFTFFLNEKT